MKRSPVFFSITLAFALWYTMFVVRPFNFWLMMSFSTSLLAYLSFAYGRPVFRRIGLTLADVGLGLCSAAALYGVFFVGNEVLALAEDWLPGLLPDRSQNLGAIYANRAELSPALVAGLLFFPIGYGEEVYWRGFVQRHFAQWWSARTAFLLTTVLYTAVHVPTGNPVLILAALTCGVFWGALYWLTGNLWPVLISHMVWDPFIFVIRPIL